MLGPRSLSLYTSAESGSRKRGVFRRSYWLEMSVTCRVSVGLSRFQSEYINIEKPLDSVVHSATTKSLLIVKAQVMKCMVR